MAYMRNNRKRQNGVKIKKTAKEPKAKIISPKRTAMLSLGHLISCKVLRRPKYQKIGKTKNFRYESDLFFLVYLNVFPPKYS